MAVFWDVAWKMVDIVRRFRGAYCNYLHITLMIDAINSSETSVSTYQSTQCDIPEEIRLIYS
jgi:hypothetical protein